MITTIVVKDATGTSADLTNKNIISERLWRLLVERIMKDWRMKRSLAERIMDQALGFLRLTAADTSQTYSPSALVDIGWHIFILHTRAYMTFCDDLAGHYIHHTPYDENEVNVALADCGPCGPCHNSSGLDPGTNNIRRTVDAMKLHGIVVDEPLWATSDDVRAATIAFGGEEINVPGPGAVPRA